MSDAKLIVADIWATGVSPDSRPLQHLRARCRSGAIAPPAQAST
jgi:error-prone DNA polymerase